MEEVHGRASPSACGQCERPAGKLYALPPSRQLGNRPPQAVCHFCYIRLTGIAPRRSALVGRPVPSRAAG